MERRELQVRIRIRERECGKLGGVRRGVAILIGLVPRDNGQTLQKCAQVPNIAMRTPALTTNNMNNGAPCKKYHLFLFNLIYLSRIIFFGHSSPLCFCFGDMSGSIL